jgi:hypothetical protein
MVGGKGEERVGKAFNNRSQPFTMINGAVGLVDCWD